MMNLFRDIRLRRRVIFVLVNLAIFLLVFGLVFQPASSLFAERDSRIEGQRKVLARLSAIAAQSENIQSLASDTDTQMRSGEFLTGPNENVISADLQTRLKAIIETSGARSRAAQALPIKTGDKIRYSGARIEIVGSLQSIHRALYAIEGAKPYLFISGAAIKMAPSIGKQGGSEEPSIQAQLDVFGATQVNGPIP
ncbi:general secretion pathway protein M [mine drainage metagenome]|uniref:General secretion pathway protein M n=1 Tax=mine drainage metagenome TaxID=410659 RepID=A0A1J5PCM6_9ZZZZ